MACPQELSTIPYGQGDTLAQWPVGVQWASIVDDQWWGQGEEIVPIEGGFEHKVLGQTFLLPCQFYCFLCHFIPRSLVPRTMGYCQLLWE
jgi:hypothetical protein